MMSTHGGHGILLLTLGFAAACGRDAVSAPPSAQSGLSPATTASASSSSDGRGESRHIALRDDCDPTDPGWAPIGGCLLRHGDVNLAEFRAFVASPLVVGMVGHPAWTIDPSYAKHRTGRTLFVRNEGGRGHTFTEVAQFGGGRIPGLNVGSTMAPECIVPPSGLDPTFVAPGASLNVTGLAAGTHRFMCCIHPWMRQVVKVGVGLDDDDNDHDH